MPLPSGVIGGGGMITVKVKLMSSFSFLSGYSKDNQFEKVIHEGSNIRELLTALAHDYGEAFKKEVYNPKKKELNATVLIVVNGCITKLLRGLDTKLHQGDVIELGHAITGG